MGRIEKMLDDTQISRLAAAGNALRPDWPVRSLVTHLSTKHRHRAYRDVAAALAYIAADERTMTPARLLEAGPWWPAASVTGGVELTERCDTHGTRHAGTCSGCRADALAGA